MYKITLNTSIPYNHSFYCPDSNVMLDSRINTTLVENLTPAMKRGIFGKTLLSEEIIIKKEEVIGVEVEVEVTEEVVKEEIVKEEIVEVVEVVEEEVAKETPKRKPRKNTKK